MLSIVMTAPLKLTIFGITDLGRPYVLSPARQPSDWVGDLENIRGGYGTLVRYAM